MKISFQQNVRRGKTEEILKELGCAFERKDDGTLFVPAEINLSGKNLKKLPDLGLVHLGGNFYCENNPDLQNLIGAPYRTDSNFFCGRNDRLSSLAGAPEEVGNDFSCFGLPALESLHGAPRKTGLNFICSGSPWVASLAGGPEETGGFYKCDKMPRVTSLEGAATKFFELTSDFGSFKTWADVPEELKISDATRRRIKEEEVAAEVRGATVVQQAFRIAGPLKIRGFKP